MGFILEGLDSESYDRTYSDKNLLKRIMSFFRPHVSRMVLLVFALFFSSLLGAAAPVLISRVVDLIAGSPSYGFIAAAALAVSALGGISWLFNYIRERVLSLVVGDVVCSVRGDVFKKVLDQDLSFFDEHSSGRIVSRVASDTQDFSNVVVLAADFASQVLMIVLLTLFLFSVNFKLTLLIIAMAPFAAAIALGFRGVARKVSLNAKRANADISKQIQESVSGIMVAKAFRKEDALFESFLSNNRLAYRVGLKRGLVLNTIFPLMGFAAGTADALIAYTGAFGVTSGVMSLGDWYLFMQAVGFFWWPLLNISSFWSQFQDGLSAAERVFSLIDREPRVRQNSSRELGPRQAGRIEFRNVSFSYSAKEQILDNFSLDISPGEVLAVVGHTGAGKSSLAKLIARFYEFQEGEILIDDTDIRSLDLDAYRRRIGFVSQDPFLFQGSVRENIRYGVPDAQDADVLNAALHLGRGDWLEDLAEGLDTDVGERGMRISYGQRQLVSLARILLKNPEIFILDEATASVDPFTEAQIQEGLSAVMLNRTAVIIAHRLTTIRHASRIIVLEAGRIAEEGTHEVLLKKKGLYSDLYTTYFRHQSLSYIESSHGLH